MTGYDKEKLTVRDKVGIRTNAPIEELQVIGNISATGYARAAQFLGDGSQLRGVATQGALAIKADRNGAVDQDFAAQNLTVDGKVGIGTTTPSEKLEVNGTVKATALEVREQINLKKGVAENLMVNKELKADGALTGKLAPPVAVGSYTEKDVQELGNYAKVKLNVNAGDIIEVIMHGSAWGQFYYDVICQPTTKVNTLASALGVFMSEGPWSSIASNGLFQATEDGSLEFSVNFFKSDVSGAIKVWKLHLVAKVLLNKLPSE